MSDGGSAQPMAISSTAVQQGGAAQPVVVVSGQPTIGGPAQPVYVVTSGPVMGGSPMRVSAALSGAIVEGGPAIPVYVVSGSLTPGGVAPVNTVLPVISGVLNVGALLTTTDGTWANVPTSFTYQWNRNAVAIGGATNSTYTVQAADIGTTLTVTVTATNAAGSTPATSVGVIISSLLLNLVAYWKLEEASGNRIDATGRGNNLAPTNAPGNAAGIVLNGVSLVRASLQYLSIADNADLSMGDIDFTISCWVRFNTLIGVGFGTGLVAKYLIAGNHREYLIIWENDSIPVKQMRFYVSSNGTAASFVSSTTVVSTGVWYNVIAWHDSVNNLIGISVNGETPVTASYSSGVSNNTSPFELGELTGIVDYELDGRMDESGVWKRMLTSGERAAIYNGGSGSTFPFEATSGHFSSLVFEDIFSGSSLDSAKWLATSDFTGNGAGGANAGELQAYTTGAVTVTGGNCVLTATDVTGTPVLGKNYTSGIIRTKGKFSFTYGRVEVRAKVTSNKGSWPAIWMLPQSDVVFLPEMDIMEAVDDMNPLSMYYHYDDGGLVTSGADYVTNLADGNFHTFRLDWTPDAIRWYFDDTERRAAFTTAPFVASDAHYLIINLAIGPPLASTPDGTSVFPTTFLIDSVRIWAY